MTQSIADVPCTDLWPVFEFRPLPEMVCGTVLRYANGAWLPDDGEYDLAFIAYGMSAPFAFYVHLPYRRNIIWSGLTTHWSANYPDHPNGNPWHYLLREEASCWGGPWGRDSHPNTKAGDEAMNRCCSLAGCANGRGPNFQDGDKHITAGLVREREGKQTVAPPAHRDCMYCGGEWEIALREAASKAREVP